MIQTNLPRWILDLVAAVPSAGSGVHQWLYRCARHLHRYRGESDIVQLLAATCRDCGRHVPESEIREAVMNSRNPNGKKRSIDSNLRDKPRTGWPAFNANAQLSVIQSSGIRCTADLWDLSPSICTDSTIDAEFFIDWLFPNNPLLCVGRTPRIFSTAPREHFRGRLSEQSLIVPSPMSALTGRRKKDGKESAHTLENTSTRKYLVTEFDSGEFDEQVAIIWHLRTYAPLVLVLSSGGKSLHGWWDCRGLSLEQTERFMRYAVSLGADPATWIPSQFVRLPQGWRTDKQRLQRVIYFDHNLLANNP